MTQHLQTGATGEDMAAEYLLRKGYTILHRNWRFKHWELDLVCSKSNRLHVVEVKTRTNKTFGHPEESINRDKFTRLKNGAEMYMQVYPQWKYLQFDVVAILLSAFGPPEIMLFEDVYY